MLGALILLVCGNLSGQEPPVAIGSLGARVARTFSPVQVGTAGRWQFAHPRATAIFGANVKSLREFSKQPALAPLLDAAPVGSELIRKALDSVDELYISVEGGKSAQPLILLIGQFGDPIIRDMLQLGDAVTAANAVLIGDAASVAAAKRRIRSHTVSPAALMAPARELSESYDLWFAGSAAGAGSLPPQANALLDGVDGLSFGLRMRQRLSAELNVRASGTQAIQKLLALYEAAKAAPPADPRERQVWEAVAKGVTVDQTPAGLRLKLDLDPAALPMDVARELRLRPPPRRSIRILGAEDGPREIPLTSPH